MEEIIQVTRNFSPSFKIGQGGFGAVYKAKLLDGTVVAVKRAKKVVQIVFSLFLYSIVSYLCGMRMLAVTSTTQKLLVNYLFPLQSVQEKHLGVEFQSEVQTLSRVEHLNLVKFYGFLDQEDERIVVVEYVPNGTLREHLDCEFLWHLSYFVCLWVALVLRPKHWFFCGYNLIKGLLQAFMETFWTSLLV